MTNMWDATWGVRYETEAVTNVGCHVGGEG